MVINAESLLPSLLAETGQEAAPLYKIRSDPRVTPVGSWLRRYSIDELPQLINVLRGEMSLVGPRPQVEFEVQTYANDVRRRLLVKPGMTGLWQINGRSDLSWDEAVRYAHIHRPYDRTQARSADHRRRRTPVTAFATNTKTGAGYSEHEESRLSLKGEISIIPVCSTLRKLAS